MGVEQNDEGAKDSAQWVELWVLGAEAHLSQTAKTWKKDLKKVGIRHRNVEFSDFGLEVLICLGQALAKRDARFSMGPQDVDCSDEARMFASEYFQEGSELKWGERYLRKGLDFPDSALPPDIFKMMPLMAFVESVVMWPVHFDSV